MLSQEMWKAPKPGPVGYLGSVGEALRVPFWVGCKDGIALGGPWEVALRALAVRVPVYHREG